MVLRRIIKENWAGKSVLAIAVSGLLLCSVNAKAEKIALIVSKTSPVATTDAKTIKDLFLGKVGAIKGEKVKPIAQDQTRPITLLFNSTVLEKTEDQMRAYWSRMVFSGQQSPPPSLADDQAVKLHVAADPSAIGYVQSSTVDDSVKVIFEHAP